MLMIFCGLTLCACSAFCEHEYGEWEIVKKSTCAENGEKARACVKCGDTETEKLELSNTHNIKDQYCEICDTIFYKDLIVTAYNMDIIGYQGQENFVIPGTFRDEEGTYYKVITLSDGAFYGLNSLKSVTIPETVENIWGAFGYCESLSEVILPDTVISIQSNAFSNTEIYKNPNNWDGGVFYIGKHLIKAEKSMIQSSYTVKEGTISIGLQAFAYCDSLESITLPSSVKNISPYAFFACNALREINLPEGLERIGHKAFAITDIKSIVIPESVTAIEDFTFERCSSLESITLSNNIKSIGKSAFEQCEALENITLPQKLINIGEAAFKGCYNLKTINFPGTKTRWNVIPKGDFGNDISSACTIICTDGTIEKTN